MPKKIPSFPLNIGNALIAEDVRPKLHGKHSVLGIYSGDILAQELTGHIRMSLYIELTAKEIGEIHVEATLTFRGVARAKVIGEFKFENPRDPAILMIPSFPILLDGPGTILVEIICDGITREILRREVRQADVVAMFSNAPAPPAAQSPTARKRKVKPL